MPVHNQLNSNVNGDGRPSAILLANEQEKEEKFAHCSRGGLEEADGHGMGRTTGRGGSGSPTALLHSMTTVDFGALGQTSSETSESSITSIKWGYL